MSLVVAHLYLNLNDINVFVPLSQLLSSLFHTHTHSLSLNFSLPVSAPLSASLNISRAHASVDVLLQASYHMLCLCDLTTTRLLTAGRRRAGCRPPPLAWRPQKPSSFASAPSTMPWRTRMSLSIFGLTFCVGSTIAPAVDGS